MKKYLFIFLLACTSYVISNAQVELPAKCEVCQPKVYLQRVITETEAKSVTSSSNYGQSTQTNKYWIAYSDRANNTTYSNPSGGSTYSKLDFNEKVRIAKISGNYALVYSDEGGTFPKITANAKSRGWIQMDHLLLWPTCPTNDKGIYYKALIVANLDKTSQNDQSLGKLYASPDKTNVIGNLTSSYDFYFIMKRANGLVLLAKQYKMAGISEQVLYGWVSESSYIPWNQRSCLEPNWNPDDVNYFKLHSVGAIVYSDKNLSNRSAEINYGNKNNEDKNKFTQYRMNRNVMRYPILDNDSHNDNVYKCTTIATAGGNIQQAAEMQRDINEAKRNALNNLQQVNLILVIDGTTSMGVYYPAVKHAILEGCESFRTDNDKNNNKIKIGVVIYRDYDDGQYMIEYTPLQGVKDPRWSNMLDTGGKYGIKSAPNDHTHTEALFQGLATALDMNKMGYNANQGNLILVVGDCGNALDDTRCMSEAGITHKLVNNNVQLMAFQVRRNNAQPWLLFNSQMNGFIKDNLELKYKALGNVKLQFKQVEGGYDLVTDLEHQFYVGTTRFAKIGEDMPAGQLSALIRKNLNLFKQALVDQIDVIFDANVTNQHDQESVIDANFLRSKVGDRIYDLIKRSNSLVSYAGYTLKKDASDRDYWKPVIYISNDELTTLIDRLQPVNNAAKLNDRKPYVDAIKALIRSMVPDITPAEMDSKSSQEIMNLITGLNVSTTTLKGPTLVQIQDPKAVDQASFLAIVNNFQKKFNNLKNIKKDNTYKYSLEINNTKYYWIPVEDLP